MLLKFDGILAFAAPMPPNEHTIKAPAILYTKAARWFKKYGYELIQNQTSRYLIRYVS